MNTRVGKVLAVSVATGLFAFATQLAVAQSYLDASSKMRGDYGQGRANSSWSGGGNYYYRTPAPVIARQQTAPSTVAKTPATTPAPNTVAKAPATTDSRTFSYQPSQSGGCGNTTSQAATTPNTTTKKDTRTTR